MKIDEFLPEYEFNSTHSVVVNASPESTMTAVRNLLPSEMPRLIFWLLNMRELPARLFGQPGLKSSGQVPFMEKIYQEGFIRLADLENELVFGMIGQFWKLSGGRQVTDISPQAFIQFKESGVAKVAAHLAVKADGGKTILSTQTRIWAPDAQTRRKFAIYWRLISLGSGWIRVMWLRAIKRKAEKGNAQ